MALNILSGMPTGELIDALAGGNVPRLVSMPGVGKKTAERLVVELQDRMAKLRVRAPVEQRPPEDVLAEEAVSALVNLGYRRPEAEKAVRAAREREGDDLAAVIRAALRKLST